jgi:broad specificity phosphatase PhoE
MWEGGFKMIVHLVRHAEKQKGDFYNPSLRRQDNPISEKGERQASLLHEYLPRHVDAILVSSQRRTKETISGYAEREGIPILEDERVNEIDMGLLSKMPRSEVQEKHPDFWKEYAEKTKDFTYPEGENGKDVSVRILSLMKDHYSRDKEMIIVGHDGWIRVFICMVLGLDFWRRFQFRVANCGISTFLLDSPRCEGSVIGINDCAYLGDAITYDK